MKKSVIYLFTLPIMMTMLSGCVMNNGLPWPEDVSSDDNTIVVPDDDGEGTPTPTPTPSGPELTTYLVLGPTGRYKGEAGSNFESVFVENAIEFKAQAGTALPTKEDVTSTTTGSVFAGWLSYEFTGAPVTYTTVPTADKTILYASFGNGTGGDGGGGTGPVVDGLPTEGFGLISSDKSTYYVGTDTGEEGGYHQYHITNASFAQGQQFQLYDFKNKAGWVVDVDPYSFGENPSAYVTKGANYYTAVQAFTADDIWIKIKESADQLYFGVNALKPKEFPAITKGTGFGIQFDDGTEVPGTVNPSPMAGFTEYYILGQNFTAGERWRVVDFDAQVGWTINFDTESLSGNYGEYFEKTSSAYKVLKNCSVDIYLKFQYENDQIYIGFHS